MIGKASKETLLLWIFKRKRHLILIIFYSDEDGFVYFNELLFKTMKRRYAAGRTKKKILFECEL